MNIFTYNTWIVLVGTTLLGLVSGMLGSFLVLRRRSLVGDAVAHAALPGIWIAFIVMGGERNFLGLLVGAFVAGLLGSWMISAIRHHTRVKEDAAIGIVLSVLFGLGIALGGWAQKNLPGSNKAGIESFIFGKTAGMLASDVVGIAVVCLLVLLVVVVLLKEFKLLSFDRDFASVQGWPVMRLDMLMMALACVTTIIGLPAVGLALMAAMLIIPGAAARFWTDRLGGMLLLSGVFGMLIGASGTLASAWFQNLPAGPIIILNGSLIFIVSMFVAPHRGVVARILRHVRFSRSINAQNLLRTMYELSEDQWPHGPWLTTSDLRQVRAWSELHARRLLHEAINEGWVCVKDGRYCLTESGWHKAAQVVRVHRLWEIFLIEDAQIAPSLVDREAEMIEHVLPEITVARLEQRLEELGLIPHPLRGVPPRHPQVQTLEESRS